MGKSGRPLLYRGESPGAPGEGAELRNPTYYTTMDQAVQGALKRAMRQGVKGNEITTLCQFIQEQERLHAELEKLIAPLESVGNTGERRGRPIKLPRRVINYIPQSLNSKKGACP